MIRVQIYEQICLELIYVCDIFLLGKHISSKFTSTLMDTYSYKFSLELGQDGK